MDPIFDLQIKVGCLGKVVTKVREILNIFQGFSTDDNLSGKGGNLCWNRLVVHLSPLNDEGES